MNALYNHALKQKSQLQQDIAKFEQEQLTAPISLQGSISSTLVSFHKTIEQYKQHYEKQRKADPGLDPKYELRLVSLTKDHGDFTEKFKELKKQYNENNARSKLFETPIGEAMGESVMNKRKPTGLDKSGNGQSGSSYELPMHEGLQKENYSLSRANDRLSLILEMGQQSLDDIVEQNQILLKVQDRMNRSLRTLGLSEQTIQTINKRVFKDKLIFVLILVLFLVGVYYVLKWFR
ncbi:Protein transport protein BOS1 [Nakaseomyces bracarensis]|uniref:Protein transport protein BOS1 n=1 Tax=Nakaseomyces bracarensis TaxID=273131 RepID=A0ABR4NLL2_9SACH